MVGKYSSWIQLGLAFSLGVGCTLFVSKAFMDSGPKLSPVLASTGGNLPQERKANPETEAIETTEETQVDHPSAVLAPISAGDLSVPLPVEWEPQMFAALDQTNPIMRNQSLVHLAVTTAVHVPRVQAECLKHLAYSLSEEEFAQFLFLIRNPSLPISVKKEFLSDSLRIRRQEFALWLAKSVAHDPQSEIAELANRYLRGEQASD